MITKILEREIQQAISDSDKKSQIHIRGDTVSIVPANQNLEESQKPKACAGTLSFKGKSYDIYIQ